MHFLVRRQLIVVTDTDRGKNKLRKLSKDAVFIVLADGKIHIVAPYHIKVHLANLLDVLPLAFVLVSAYSFLSKAIPEFEELNGVLGCLFEHDEPIDTPSVEAHTILPVQHKLCEKLEDDEYDFIIGVEGV